MYANNINYTTIPITYNHENIKYYNIEYTKQNKQYL